MNFRSHRATLVSTTSALALAVVSAVPALAQDQQAQGGGLQLEEIIVNARRVDENIQRVPIAITAFSPEKLAAQDVKDIWTLTKNVGGLNICCSPGNTSFIFVRGIGNGTPTYFNDVPVDSGGFANFFDVSNVQVLKGPQGTLFGQASNAGALVYQPKKPGDVFGGFVNVTAGNYGRRSVEGAVDLPIIEDKVLFRVAAQSFYREGFIEDIRSQRFLGDQNYYIIRPSLVIRPTEDIENHTLFQLTKSKSLPLPFVLTDINSNDTVGFSLTGGPLASDIRNTQRAGNIGLVADPAGANLWNSLRDQVLSRQIALGRYKVDGYSSGCNTPLGPSEGIGADPYGPAVGNGGSGPITNLNYARAACQFSWNREILFTNTTTWNFADNLSLKNIFGYRNTHSFSQPSDTDGTPLILFDGGSPKNGTVNRGTPVWSDELQLQGTKIFDFLDFTVGTFHTGRQNKPVTTYSYSLGVSETAAATKNSSKSRGVYGQANVDIGHFVEALDGLTFTGGYRHTWDHLTQIIYSVDPVTGGPALDPITGLPRPPLGAPGTVSAGAGDARFNAGAWTFQLQYQWTPDIMFFANASKGYSAGGLQDVLGFETFSPDVLINYEGGIKGTFDIGPVKVRTATSYFYGDYSGVKVSVTKLAQKASAPTAAPSLIVSTENAAEGYITGLDSDVTIVPTEWLELGGNVAYTKTKYTKWDNFVSLDPANPTVLTPVSFASTPFSFTPKWKYTLRGTIHLPVDEATMGSMSISANYTHTGIIYNTAKPRVRTIPGNPNTGITEVRCRTAANGYGPLSADGKCVNIDTNPSYNNLDLNFDWRDVMGTEGLTAGVFVTNVTKNEHGDGQCGCDVALGVTSHIPQVPRMFGVKVGYSF